MSWHTVHECSTSDARLVCGFLDNDAVVTRIVDAAGAEVSREKLDSAISPVSIGVRSADANTAKQNIAELLATSKQTPVDGSLERLGTSIRACAMSPFAPWGVVLAPRYLLRAGRSDLRPREHRWNLAAIVICAMFTAIYTAAVIGTVLQ